MHPGFGGTRRRGRFSSSLATSMTVRECQMLLAAGSLCWQDLSSSLGAASLLFSMTGTDFSLACNRFGLHLVAVTRNVSST